MPKLEIRFGRQLRKLRIARQLSQESLAAKIGISYQAISNIERGINAPSFGTLERIAAILEIELKELFDFP